MSEQALCGCGHTRRWHGDGGNGRCEGPQCDCRAFTEYVKLPVGPVDLAAVVARMLELEHAIPMARPDEVVSIADVIAELCSIERGDELETALLIEIKRAMALGRDYYAEKLGVGAGDLPLVECTIGFLQGVTFARAIADVRDED